VQYTVYRLIYEKFSFLIRRRVQNGRILRHSRAMSGFAGLSPSRNRKLEGSTLSGYARSLKKECAGLVAGQAVLTAQKRRTSIRHFFPSTLTKQLLPSNTYVKAEHLLTRHVLWVSHLPCQEPHFSR
jgi:hypothetical protein